MAGKSSQEETRDRRAGVLLHPTSLPGPGPAGTLGEHALRFVDWLADAGATLWQVLPLGPVDGGGSPYSSSSAFAGEPSWIDLRDLEARGWLRRGEVRAGERGVEEHRHARVVAAQRFASAATTAERRRWLRFRAQASWLDDFALFRAIHQAHEGKPWWLWPAPLRDRKPAELRGERTRLAEAIERNAFEQFAFFEQWNGVRKRAQQRGVQIVGDVPIYVAADSADVWANRPLFDLDARGRPNHVAGVPPDAFSKTGQRWGNPLYDWDAMARDRYRWWQQRISWQLAQVDWLRIDHFRGLVAYWEVPRRMRTARRGRWRPGPGEKLFRALRKVADPLPVIAEDLGVITPDVVALRQRLGLRGMRVLQFAYGSDANNDHLPHCYERDVIAYTGTHDNDTTLGWFHNLGAAERARVIAHVGEGKMPWPLIHAAMGSIADWAIVPLQDLLELGSEARMNVPGTTGGHWSWRFDWKSIPRGLATRFRSLTEVTGRIG